ncbi:hypothetical protein [Cellulomonas pakistanensis]|uniref:Uncharacterized protein n=1 Tax=Cellulomonas pakistanensis TaxID=992287 RepID=A0A919PG34_9CELL|nr:hypothetical protein [Cellulomonas pakistanensis]GIG37532.1 hypothetical protein Cpa01nite_29130 [Cellulomonas pakistanensis]
MTAPGPRRVPRLLVAHAAVAAAVTVLLLVLALQPTEDANIGAGIALLATLPFGLPWTLGLLAAPTSWPGAALVAVAVGAAWLNVGLHALVRARLRRRRATVLTP